jgi:hypothetical protein
MIKTITSADFDVAISGQPGPYHSGHVIWDGNAQKFKVLDNQGVSQDMHGAHAFITMGSDWQSVKVWVYTKMAEEADLKRLCAEYPNLEQARQEFEMMKQLVQDHK